MRVLKLGVIAFYFSSTHWITRWRQMFKREQKWQVGGSTAFLVSESYYYVKSIFFFFINKIDLQYYINFQVYYIDSTDYTPFKFLHNNGYTPCVTIYLLAFIILYIVVCILYLYLASLSLVTTSLFSICRICFCFIIFICLLYF